MLTSKEAARPHRADKGYKNRRPKISRGNDPRKDDQGNYYVTDDMGNPVPMLIAQKDKINGSTLRGMIYAGRI